MKHRRQRGQRGNSIIEFSLMTPWLIFLFIGAMDWGFYAYSLIATEAAARVGALYTSTSNSTVSDTTSVCQYALDQLRRMPNVGTGMTSCASGSSVSGSSPVGVSASSVTGPDGNSAAQVSVTYLTPVFIPQILGNGGSGLPSQVTITRTIQMRMRN
jgi:Flp pilus assembly protein TadG